MIFVNQTAEPLYRDSRGTKTLESRSGLIRYDRHSPTSWGTFIPFMLGSY
jgi:hypothetical protein